MSGNLTGIFDQDTAPEAENNFDLLPPGDYSGEIARAELRPTRLGGSMISLDILLDNGRHVFDNLNIVCSNETAQRIAQASLKRIGDTNRRKIRDTDDLLQCRVKVKVGVRPAQGEYDARNVVKFYQDLKTSGAVLPSAASARSEPTVAKAAARSTSDSAAANPWMKKKEPVPADLDDEIPF